ncbi:MAG TPA: hypothetical protein VFO16_16275 [Pseudonocardiaceae bacterium]|nr:hypothetical protein [Pseudonocardiaceae bacterium]
MPRYGPVWLEIAREQYTSLAADARAQIDTRVEQLLENPSKPTPTTTKHGAVQDAAMHTDAEVEQFSPRSTITFSRRCKITQHIPAC